MVFAADELLQELTRTDATLREVLPRAGQGCGPDFEQRLEAHVRSLRSMLGADDLAVAIDTMEAARQVMVSTDPAAPLLMLAMARKTLSAVIHRQANTQRLHTAA
ncbi:MAG: hypothetical protein ABIO58_05925 [Luteimonas sp.]